MRIIFKKDIDKILQMNNNYDIRYQLIITHDIKMNNQPTIIKVCNGAGCNAWDASDILRDLPENVSDFLENVKVCEVSCLNSCGGGVSVQVNEGNEKIVKIRKPHQAMDQILPHITSPVQA